MAFRMCWGILFLINCRTYAGGCSDAHNQMTDTNKRLKQLEDHQEAFKTKLDQMFENLDEVVKPEVERRLSDLVESKLDDLLKSENLSDYLSTNVIGEMQVMKQDFRILRNELDETVKRIEIIETENIHLEETLSTLQNEMSVLKESNVDCDNELGERTQDDIPQSIKMTRILFLPWGHTEPQQIDIANNSLSEYPLGREGFQSVEYYKKNSSVLTTVVEPFGFGSKIYISDIDSGEKTTLLTRQESQGITVDEENELIYFSTSRPRNTVSKINVDGSNFTQVADLSSFKYPCSLVLDTNSSFIYVATTNDLVSLTYEGTELKSIYRGLNIMALAIDVEGRTLYFNDGTFVKTFSLKDGLTAFVKDLEFRPWNFVYYKEEGVGVLFVSSFRRKMIGKVELTNNNTYVPILSGCTPCHHVTSICLLP